MTPAYASGGRRLLASIIDNLTWLIAISWLLGYLPERTVEDHPEVLGLTLFVIFSLWFNYFAFCEWRWGQTIGKNATGIEVTSLDGSKIGFGQASIRNLLRLIDWLLIGWVMIAATARKQRLGDKAAKTVVLRRAPRGAPATPLPAAVGSPPASSSPAPPAVGPAPPAPAGTPQPSEAKPPDPRGRLPAISWSVSDTAWGVVAGLLLAVLVAPLLVVPFDPDLDSTGALLAAQALLGASLLAVAVGVASRWRFAPIKEALTKLGLRRFGWAALGWMLLALLAYYIAAGLFAALVLEPEQEDISGELGVGDENLLVAILAVALIVGLAPISEELFFRGFLFSGLRSRFSLWPAAVIAGAVFGLVHVATGITTVIPLAALGVALAWLYERTGSLWPCVLAHMMNNGVAVVLVT